MDILEEAEKRSKTTINYYLFGLVKIKVYQEFRSEDDYKSFVSLYILGLERWSYITRDEFQRDVYDKELTHTIKYKLQVLGNWFMNTFYYKFK